MWATSAIMSLHLRLALFTLAHLLAELVAHITGIRRTTSAGLVFLISCPTVGSRRVR